MRVEQNVHLTESLAIQMDVWSAKMRDLKSQRMVNHESVNKKDTITTPSKTNVYSVDLIAKSDQTTTLEINVIMKF